MIHNIDKYIIKSKKLKKMIIVKNIKDLYNSYYHIYVCCNILVYFMILSHVLLYSVFLFSLHFLRRLCTIRYLICIKRYKKNLKKKS